MMFCPVSRGIRIVTGLGLQNEENMYKVTITYDTGDSFHREDGVIEDLEMQWVSIDKAKQALKDIEEHYFFYMMMKKEWNADKNDQKKAKKNAQGKPWYAGDRHPYYSVLLENDEGERVSKHAFWTGYFEHLVGGEVGEVEPTRDGMSFRT